MRTGAAEVEAGGCTIAVVLLKIAVILLKIVVPFAVPVPFAAVVPFVAAVPFAAFAVAPFAAAVVEYLSLISMSERVYRSPPDDTFNTNKTVKRTVKPAAAAMTPPRRRPLMPVKKLLLTKTAARPQQSGSTVPSPS